MKYPWSVKSTHCVLIIAILLTRQKRETSADIYLFHRKKINVYSLKRLNKLQQRQDLIIIKLVAKQNIVLLVQGVTISIRG